MKTRKESFFGLHFDYHAQPKYGIQGATLKEEDIREICQKYKPDFIQIDCKGHPGWASYPSKIGNAMPEFAQDTLALWRRVTREEGVALYMHYSGVYDIKYCNEHPEENVLFSDGRHLLGATRTNGHYVNEVLIPQMTELAEVYGVDGFWVDGECWRAQADFHPESLAAFEKDTGVSLNGAIPATPDDPYYDEYREYFRNHFRKYLNYYVDTMHDRFPNLQIASNWAFSDHMPERVCANVDYLSGDLNPYGSVQSARYAARALAQQNYPWDLMSWNFRIQVGERAAMVVKHPIQILQEAASVIALGGAYQVYNMQNTDGSPVVEQLQNLTELSDFMRAREPFCFRGQPIHQAAVFLSTYDRNRESKRLYSRNGYEKIMGMTALMCDIGQSVEIVGEHTLEKETACYKMIVVPELYCGVAPETAKLLLDYARNGGNLVISGKNACRVFANAGAPFSVIDHKEFFDPDEKAYDNGGDNGHDTNAAARHRAYMFALTEREYGALFSPCEISAEGEVIATFTEKTRGKQYPLAIKIPYGNGFVTAIGFDIGSQYLSGTQYLHRTLMKTVADKLYVPAVKVESVCGRLEIVDLQKDGKLMIQLLNANGTHNDPTEATDDCIPPIVDARLSIELATKPQALLLQPEARSLPFTYRDGRAYVTVDRIDLHSIIEVVE